MGAYAYAFTNLLNGLAAAAFTWSSGANDATRAYLNDGWMDARYNNDGGGGVGSGLSVIIDLGSAVALSGFAILNSNAAVQKTDATVTIDSSDTGTFGVGHIDHVKAASFLNSTAPYNKDHVLQFPLSTARRYWRLTWTFSGGVTNFSIGELFAFASQTQLSRKRIYGGGEGEKMLVSKVSFYGGGSRGYKQGGPVRRKVLPFSDLSTSERNELLTMWRAVNAGATPLLWIESYEATATAAATPEQEVVYGLLGPDDFPWVEPDFNLYNPPDLVVESLGREIGS